MVFLRAAPTYLPGAILLDKSTQSSQAIDNSKVICPTGYAIVAVLEVVLAMVMSFLVGFVP